MLPFLSLAVAALLGQALAAPVVPVHPGGPKAIVISSEDTLNATTPAPSQGGPKPSNRTSFGTMNLPLSFYNNLDSSSVNAYVTGLNDDGQLVFVQSDGSFYYPTCDSSTGVPQEITGSINIPLGGLGSTTSVTLPDYISSARIWLADGTLLFYTVCGSDGDPSLVEPSSANPEDPNADTNWGFVEFTNNEDELDANISYVDLVGLPLGMTITHSDGSQETVQGVQADAVDTICNALVAQAASDGQPWGDLCQVDSNGDYIRAIAPIDYISENPDAFEDYWTDYVNDVWSYYTDNTLTINSQDNINSAGNDNNITCTVSGSTMTCNQDDGTTYSQPAAVDIFGCNSGPFANTGDETNLIIIARLCAAFDRTTLLLSGGDIQPALPSTDYYSTGPTNYYSKFVHEQEADGMGYAFSYDDVNSTGENQSGTLTSGNPQGLEIIVGGPVS